MLYLIIAIVCLVLSGYLFKIATGTISLRSPNMMSLIFYFYFALENVVGAVLIVNNIDDHYIINKLSNDIYRYYGFWAIMYTIVLFPIGMLMANMLFKAGGMNDYYEDYVTSPITDEPEEISNHVRNCLIVLSVISVLAVLYTLASIGGSPLSALLSGMDPTDLNLMRSEANRGFSGNEYFRNVFGILLTPFLSYVAYGYKIYDNSIFNKCWFYVMLVSSILILTYDLEKAPLLWYLLGFMFYRVYLGYRLSNMVLISVFAVFSGLIIGMYVVLSSFDLDTLFVFNQGIIGRLTLSSNAGVFVSFELFPQNHDFLGLSSFSNLISDFLSVPYNERSARLVMEFVNPSGVEQGIAGVFNSLFVSEAWANWGIIGLLLSPIYVGFLIQCLYLFLLFSRKTPVFMGLLVFYTIRCSINGGINDYIYNISTLIMVIVIVGIYSTCKNANSVSNI